MKREIEPLGRKENMEKSRWLKLEEKAKDKEIYLCNGYGIWNQ